MGFVYFVLWHRLTLLSTSERAKFSPLAPTDGCPLASAGSSDPFFREGSWLSGLATGLASGLVFFLQRST